MTQPLTNPVSQLDAAQWAHEVGLELAKLLPDGTTEFGLVGYRKGYISLVSSVCGADPSYALVKPLYYTKGSLVEGSGLRDPRWRPPHPS